MKKKIPKFEEEMEFWDTHSVTEFEAKEVTVEEILEELKHHSTNELLWQGLESASAET